jgi:hypothetical protein
LTTPENELNALEATLLNAAREMHGVLYERRLNVAVHLKRSGADDAEVTEYLHTQSDADSQWVIAQLNRLLPDLNDRFARGVLKAPEQIQKVWPANPSRTIQ